MNVLTRRELEKRRFGGNERKVYTKMRDEIQGHRYQVIHIFYRKSGKHVTDFQDGNYFINFETHKILELVSYDVFKTQIITIENKNVKKVHPDLRNAICSNCRNDGRHFVIDSQWRKCSFYVDNKCPWKLELEIFGKGTNFKDRLSRLIKIKDWRENIECRDMRKMFND